MNLHEYQAKSLFTGFGIPVPANVPVGSADEAVRAAQNLGGESWMVKAQIHAGSRGVSGGVKRVNSIEELIAASEALLGKTLATPQTDGEQLPVNRVLIEQAISISRELYLSALVDRDSETITFMASTEGGINIEEVAEQTPEKIIRIHVNPCVGLQAYQCRQIAFALQLEGSHIAELTDIMMGLYNLFIYKDLTLVEINPLVISHENMILALDAKLNIDDNALYRRPDLQEMRDPTQENIKEARALQSGINYIALNGNIGCMVNGAGLAMATMDLIKLQGGEPANFLDVSGGTTTDKVAESFQLILSEPNVKVILVNIFGGIVHCDLIADGIIQAMQEANVTIPVIVFLAGTNAREGLDILAQSTLNIDTASDLTEAAEKAVACTHTCIKKSEV